MGGGRVVCHIHGIEEGGRGTSTEKDEKKGETNFVDGRKSEQVGGAECYVQ